jgi:hypothetical protein
MWAARPPASSVKKEKTCPIVEGICWGRICMCHLATLIFSNPRGGGGIGKNHRSNVREKIRSNILIVEKFCKKCTYSIGGSKIIINDYI